MAYQIEGNNHIINTWPIQVVEMERLENHKYNLTLAQSKPNTSAHQLPKQNPTFRQNFCIFSLGPDKLTGC